MLILNQAGGESVRASTIKENIHRSPDEDDKMDDANDGSRRV